MAKPPPRPNSAARRPRSVSGTWVVVGPADYSAAPAAGVWNELLHPREPSGGSDGGRFAPAGEGVVANTEEGGPDPAADDQESKPWWKRALDKVADVKGEWDDAGELGKQQEEERRKARKAAGGSDEWAVIRPGQFDWDESQHPRGPDGRFGGDGGGEGNDSGSQPWMDQGAPWSDGGTDSTDPGSYYDNASPYAPISLAPPWDTARTNEAMSKVDPGPGRPDGKGTADDPIAVGDDIERAAQLIGEGKHVRLDQPDQVVVLLDKVKELAAEAKAKGEKAPEYNLCNVTIPGTNLFCADNMDIARDHMPQLSGVTREGSPAALLRKDPTDAHSEADITRQFREALQAQGIKVTDKVMPASHLRATQNQLDGVKVAGIAGAMRAGKIPEEALFVTRDNYVIDGHHRWAAKIGNDAEDGVIGDVTMPVKVVDMDIGAALDYANAFANEMGIQQKKMAQVASRAAAAFARRATADTVLGLGAFTAAQGPPPFAA